MAVGPRAKKRWLSIRLPLQPWVSLLDGVMGQGVRKQSPENWGGELGEGYGGKDMKWRKGRWGGWRVSRALLLQASQASLWSRTRGPLA